MANARALNGKIAVVTGAAQGLGRAIAARFVHEGAAVLLSDINDKKGQSAADTLEASGGRVAYVHCDVSKPEETAALMQAAVEIFGGLDIAVANAAVLDLTDFLEITPEDWERVLSVNLSGFFYTGQAAAREMVDRGTPGAIINMSSVNAVVAIPNAVAYGACKGGVQQLTKTMAIALAKHGIRVNAIGPGTIATEMAMQIAQDPAALRKIRQRTPMDRMGEPAEIASIAVFLASDQSSYVTGETIYADGGRLGLNYMMDVADQ